MSDPATTQRLDRIEQRLDRIADAVETLVRVDERQIHQADGMRRIGSKVDGHESRITAAERRLDAGAVRISYGERVWWVIVSGALGVAGFLGWRGTGG